MNLPRPELLAGLDVALERAPITALLGPRQCGKTTLARMRLDPGHGNYFDLESPASAARLREPMLALERLRGLVVIDEIQRQPELFPILRVLADRSGLPARFLVLGSVSPELIRDASESLAGRVEFVRMVGFTLSETGPGAWRKLWLRGGFPPSFLARDDEASFAWRMNFIETFLERDLARAGIRVNAAAMRRFWQMLAQYHGQTWNGSEIGNSLGVAQTTARSHLDILSGAFVVRQLQPWYENIGKRQVKSPKVYIRDSGLFHGLMSLETEVDLESHPKLGAGWEGFALEQVLALTGERDTWFWGTHGGAELDLMVRRGGRKYGFEFKYSDAPKMTRSMHSALESLGLERIAVIYPGREVIELHEKVTAVPITRLGSEPPFFRVSE